MRQMVLTKDTDGIKEGTFVLMIGEITNMPGHYAFVDTNGLVHWAYHNDNFREYDEERD